MQLAVYLQTCTAYCEPHSKSQSLVYETLGDAGAKSICICTGPSPQKSRYVHAAAQAAHPEVAIYELRWAQLRWAQFYGPPVARAPLLRKYWSQLQCSVKSWNKATHAFQTCVQNTDTTLEPCNTNKYNLGLPL